MARGPLAGASGPGKYSKRTDGMRLPSKEYGEGVETASIQSAAPMATTQGAAEQQLRKQPVQPIGMFEPTQRPEEPVTAGVDVGPGPGSSALMMNQQMDTTEDMDRLRSYLPALEVAAQNPKSSQAFRNYVRTLRAQLL